MKRVYTVLGTIFLIIGFIGLLLPIMPTVPFLFVAYICFAKSNGRFYHWFRNTEVFKKYEPKIKCIEEKIPFLNRNTVKPYRA